MADVVGDLLKVWATKCLARLQYDDVLGLLFLPLYHMYYAFSKLNFDVLCDSVAAIQF